MLRFDNIRVEPDAIWLAGRSLTAERNVSTGDVTVTVDGSVHHRIRQWTFAERTRLLDTHAANRVSTDVSGLVDDLVGLLVTPEPTPQHRGVVGLASLAWSVGGATSRPSPVPGVTPAEQMVTLAASTNWSPDDIQSAPAADVDRWYAACTAKDDAHAERPDDDDQRRTFLFRD